VQLLPGDAATHDARHKVIGLLKLAAFLGTAIVWLTWLHRAYGNLGLVGSKRSDSLKAGPWLLLIPFVTWCARTRPEGSLAAQRIAERPRRIRQAAPPAFSPRGGGFT